MFTILFIILMFAVFGKIIAFAVRATWGISKVLLFIICPPIILIVMVFAGLLRIAIPVLLIIGIISLFRPRYKRL